MIEHAPALPVVHGPVVPGGPAAPLDPQVLFLEGMDYVQVIDSVCSGAGAARAR